MKTTSLVLLLSTPLCAGHGVFWSPLSRAQIAQDNGWEADTTSIIAEPMPEVAEGREYPGGRPWAEPGQSATNIGPCGMKNYAQKTNWHVPQHGWGLKPESTYQAGDVIDVSWCVSDEADHGGHDMRRPAPALSVGGQSDGRLVGFTL